MGRVNHQTPAAAQSPSTMKHFTHPHDLHPLSLYKPQPLCSGCKLPSRGIMYTCTPCNFTLHRSCANLPQLITHPSHAGCTLSLHAAAPYPAGRFICNACNLTADSWSYHCGLCDYDLHVTCATKPLNITHHSHSSCKLDLIFKNPYKDSKGFSCDICRKIGSNQWLYRCNSCQFDVHLDCAAAAAPRPTLQHQRSAPLPAPTQRYHNQNQFMHSASSGGMNIHGDRANQFVPPPYAAAQPHLMGNPYAGNINLYQQQEYGGVAGNIPAKNNGAGKSGGLGLGGNVVLAAVQGFVEGAFQGVGQAVVQGVIGAAAGGEDMSSC